MHAVRFRVLVVIMDILGGTPRKINMEPENAGLEVDFPFQLGDF